MAYSVETVLFSLVSFFPFLLLELLAFRRSLRFSSAATAALTGLISLMAACLSPYFAPIVGSNRLILLQNLCGGLFFLFAAKDQMGKKLFTLLMIANDANLAFALAEHVRHRLLPGLASQPYHWYHSLILLGIELLILAPMFVYVRQIFAHTLSGNRRLNAWNYLWLIPLTFYLIWLTLFFFDSPNAASSQFVLISLMLFLGGVFVYVMVSQFIKEHRQKEELQEKEYALAMQQTQYEHLQERIEEARRAKHDLRHHLHLVSAYLNDGRMDDLRAYLQKYSDAIGADHQIVYCGHYAVNALLLYFASQAQSSGIRYNVSADIPSQIAVPDEDLVVVLGNLLENAITACKQETGEPAISVYVRKDDIAVFLKITNTCTRRATCSKGQGLGLGSVRNIARRYDGIMESGQKGHLFTVSVMLPIPDPFEP